MDAKILRQFALMYEKIDNYSRGKISLYSLLNDIEALINIVNETENIGNEFRRNFYDVYGDLDVIIALGTEVRDKEIIIKTYLPKIKNIINEFLLSRNVNPCDLNWNELNQAD